MENNKKKGLLAVIVLIVLGAVLFTVSRDPSGIKNEDGSGQSETSEAGHSDLIDASGDPVNFEDFEGRVVFVNNWATWCQPCVVEMPTIDDLKISLKEQDPVFVMVSFDQYPQKSFHWMKKKGFDLPVYLPGENFPKAFMTDAIPATFVLNKSGEVVYKHVGMADYSKESFKEKMRDWIAE